MINKINKTQGVYNSAGSKLILNERNQEILKLNIQLSVIYKALGLSLLHLKKESKEERKKGRKGKERKREREKRKEGRRVEGKQKQIENVIKIEKHPDCIKTVIIKEQDFS